MILSACRFRCQTHNKGAPRRDVPKQRTQPLLPKSITRCDRTRPPSNSEAQTPLGGDPYFGSPPGLLGSCPGGGRARPPRGERLPRGTVGPGTGPRQPLWDPPAGRVHLVWGDPGRSPCPLGNWATPNAQGRTFSFRSPPGPLGSSPGGIRTCLGYVGPRPFLP